MKKIVASVGLVALGAASVQTQSSAQTATIQGPPPKWWNVSATVRGFYDDNANTAPTGVPGVSPIATFGYELSPSVGIAIGNQQTTLSLNYTYDFIYYEKRLSGTVTNQFGQSSTPVKYDQDHTFNAALDHAFSERYNIHVSDSFVIGQQPDALRAGNAITAFYRIPGDNIVNSGTIIFNGELTRLLGFQLGYNNALYHFNSDVIGSTLDRDENYAHADLTWQVQPETIGRLGYQFGYVDYTGDGTLADQNSPTGVSPVDVRNVISHTVYAGADHNFLPELVGSVKAGASYYDYYNSTGASDFGPYALVNLTYTYAPESTASIGFQEGRIASTVTSGTAIVYDTETSVVYGQVVHRIIPNLFGTLRGTYQNSNYHGGGPGIDGEADQFYEAEVDLDYRFCPNFAVHAGYDYDRLGSGINSALAGLPKRSYDRNRFYIGATASY
jgi:hypothetical protein